MHDPVKVTVILNRSDNWWDWFYSVRGAAKTKDVWVYIDPDLKDDKIIAEPSSPTDPEYTDLGTDVTSIEKVIEKKLEGVWKEKNRLYDKEMTKYLLIKKNLDAIRTHILETVNRAHTHPLQNANSVRDMIVLLRDIYKPDDANRIDDVHDRFQKLSQGPKNVSVEKWIHDWQTLISDAQDVGLPMYAGRGALIAFIKALKTIDYQYADKRHDKIKDGEDLEVFHEMQKFLNEYTESRKGTGRNAYATFQDQSDSQTEARNAFTKKTNMDCICGKKHRFSQCPYVVESIRPAGWTANKDIQQKFNEAKENPILKGAMERGIQYAKRKMEQSKETKTEPRVAMSVYRTSFSVKREDDYDLKDGWIADTGSDTHVCNDRNRLISYRPEPEIIELKHGNASTPIEGWGTVRDSTPISSR